MVLQIENLNEHYSFFHARHSIHGSQRATCRSQFSSSTSESCPGVLYKINKYLSLKFSHNITPKESRVGGFLWRLAITYLGNSLKWSIFPWCLGLMPEHQHIVTLSLLCDGTASDWQSSCLSLPKAVTAGSWLYLKLDLTCLSYFSCCSHETPRWHRLKKERVYFGSHVEDMFHGNLKQQLT